MGLRGREFELVPSRTEWQARGLTELRIPTFRCRALRQLAGMEGAAPMAECRFRLGEVCRHKSGTCPKIDDFPSILSN